MVTSNFSFSQLQNLQPDSIVLNHKSCNFQNVPSTSSACVSTSHLPTTRLSLPVCAFLYTHCLPIVTMHSLPALGPPKPACTEALLHSHLLLAAFHKHHQPTLRSPLLTLQGTITVSFPEGVRIWPEGLVRCWCGCKPLREQSGTSWKTCPTTQHLLDLYPREFTHTNQRAGTRCSCL